MNFVETETTDKTLPYGTSSENIQRLLDAIKKKHGDEKGIRAVYSGAKIDSTRKTMESLNLIHNFDFERLGKELAYETNDQKKQEIFRKVVLNYAPYELFLVRMSEDDFLEETNIEEVKNFWGKNDFGASSNNRDEAASVFGSFIQLAGLGEFISGRRGKSTRLKWALDAKKLIDDALEQLGYHSSSDSCGEVDEDKLHEVDELHNDENEVVSPKSTMSTQDKEVKIEKLPPNSIKTIESFKVTPNITINVDMTNWESEKIKEFFRAAYGEFNND